MSTATIFDSIIFGEVKPGRLTGWPAWIHSLGLMIHPVAASGRLMSGEC